MRTTSVIFLALPVHVILSFKTGSLVRRAQTPSVLYGLSSGKAEWAADDDGPSGFRDVSSQRKLNTTFINNLVSPFSTRSHQIFDKITPDSTKLPYVFTTFLSIVVDLIRGHNFEL